MNQTDLPNICFIINIVEKLQWEVMNRLRKEANGIILDAQDPLANPKAINFVSRVRQSAYALTYFDSLLVTEYILCKYDLSTILKVIKTYYQAHGRKVFREYYEQESRRERLYTYQIAPEITESYILGRCASTGDPNDPAIYRGIIEGIG